MTVCGVDATMINHDDRRVLFAASPGAVCANRIRNPMSHSCAVTEGQLPRKRSIPSDSPIPASRRDCALNFVIVNVQTRNIRSKKRASHSHASKPFTTYAYILDAMMGPLGDTTMAAIEGKKKSII